MMWKCAMVTRKKSVVALAGDDKRVWLTSA
jgi:hypothetical protein